LPIKLNPNFSIKKAHQLQRNLSQKLIFEDMLPKTIDYVAGVDIAYHEGVSIAAAVVLDCNTLSVIEFQTAKVKTRFPYVPTPPLFQRNPTRILNNKTTSHRT
jgi:deoxyinosine 3'endonuclease (endonuclease V)